MSTAIAPIESVRNALTKMEGQFKMALPTHIKPDKFIRTVMTAIQNNPKLLECDRNSLFSSCMKAASDGLLVDSREAAILPYKGKAQYLPMIAGICKKARNSGEVAALTVNCVYKNEPFTYKVTSDGEVFNHEPILFGERGDMIGAYALAKLKDGDVIVEAMSLEEINKVRSVSPAKDSGPWRDWFSEMAKKTVLRRLAKYRLPSSTDLINTIKSDDDLFVPERDVTPSQEQAQSQQTTEPSEPAAQDAKPKAKTKSSRLSKAVKKKDEPTPEPQPEPEQEAIDVPHSDVAEEPNDLDKALSGEDEVI